MFVCVWLWGGFVVSGQGHLMVGVGVCGGIYIDYSLVGVIKTSL